MSKKITDDENQNTNALMAESQRVLEEVRAQNRETMKAIDVAAQKVEKDIADLRKIDADLQYEEDELAVRLTEAVAESFEQIARGNS